MFTTFLGVCCPWVLICLNSSNIFYSRGPRNTSQVYNSNNLISYTNICCELYVAIKNMPEITQGREALFGLSVSEGHTGQHNGKTAMRQQKHVTASPGDRQDTEMLSMYDQPLPPSTHTHAVIFFRLHDT